VKPWMHPTHRFEDAVDSIKAELRSEAGPVLKALVDTYSQLFKDPWTFKNSDQRQGKNFLHTFYPGFVLVYRIEGEFQGEATLIREHVYLKNILRKN
jgi:hypothetical protein